MFLGHAGEHDRRMAVADPTLAAGVAYYGRQAPAADVPKISAPLMLHYASLDERVNAGWISVAAQGSKMIAKGLRLNWESVELLNDLVQAGVNVGVIEFNGIYDQEFRAIM